MHTTRRADLRVGGALWIVAGIAYLVTEAVVAQSLSGYSYAADYVSDLGQPLRSPLAAWMNGAFIAQGVAFAAAAFVVAARSGPVAARSGPVAARLDPGAVAFLGLAVIYGAGSVTVGLVPSGGTGTPALVHVGAAVAAILAGNLAVIAAGAVLLQRRRFRAFGYTSVVFGVAGLVCGGILLCAGALDTQVLYGAGAWERASIYSIIGWQLLAGSAAQRLVQRSPR